MAYFMVQLLWQLATMVENLRTYWTDCLKLARTSKGVLLLYLNNHDFLVVKQLFCRWPYMLRLYSNSSGCIQRQLEAMTEAYMEWSMSQGDEGLGNLNVETLASEVTDGHNIMVIDLFSQCVLFSISYLLADSMLGTKKIA